MGSRRGVCGVAGIGPRIAERVTPGATAGVINAIADFETAFLVLEITQSAGYSDFRLTSLREVGRVAVSDRTIDAYATGADATPGPGIIASAPGLTNLNVHVVGRGARGFVTPNDTEANRARNRRVGSRVEEPAP